MKKAFGKHPEHFFHFGQDNIRFAKADCRSCLVHFQCAHTQPPRRTVTVRPQTQQLALQAAREREKTEVLTK